MDDFSNISGGIFISPRNKMSGRVLVIGTDKATLNGSIIVTKFFDLVSHINIYTDEVIVNPSYPPVIGSQRRAKIEISYRSNLQSNIKITPRNKMTGLIQIIEPPTYTIELESVKDSFVRSLIPTLNYGDIESMLVGYQSSLDDTYRSFIKFDTSNPPENAIIESATLRLYNSQINTGTHQVGVYSASSDWNEYGITWANQPAVKDLLSIIPLGSVGYTDIDVSETVKSWFENPQENNGFILRALNESYNQIEQFSTRESAINKPYLQVKYKLDVIYSYGELDRQANIYVRATDKSTRTGSITVNQYDDDREIPCRIHVLNLNYWMEASVSVNRPSLVSALRVKQYDEDEILSSVQVRVKGGYLPQDQLKSTLTANTPDKVSKLRIPYRNNLESSLYVAIRKKDSSPILGSIIITKSKVRGSIRVKQKDYSERLSNIRVRLNRNVEAGIVVNRRELVGQLTVTYYSDKAGSITVRQLKNLPSNIVIYHRSNLIGSINIIHANHLPSSLFVISGYLRSSITIPAHGEHSIHGRIRVRVRRVSEINGAINVGGDNILGGFVYIL